MNHDERLLFGYARRKTVPQLPVSPAGYFSRRVWGGGHETQTRSSPNTMGTANILLDTVKSVLADLAGA